MIKVGDYVVTPTIFPDGTSQVWKLPDFILESNLHDTITWEFDSEAEIIHVIQLAVLLKHYHNSLPILVVPFLPYARQDKDISNITTFARDIFIDLIRPYFIRIETLDIHSKAYSIVNRKPDISKVLLEVKPDVIVYPDAGAGKRGYDSYYYTTIDLDKNRDQNTGEILGLAFKSDERLIKDKTILIQDDICDGGRTFIEAAKLLKGMGAKSVCLYTTHGIYSKGVKVILDGGIDRIFNYKGEVKDGN